MSGAYSGRGSSPRHLGAMAGPTVCQWSSWKGLWLFVSSQPKVTAGWRLTCSRAVASAEEGAPGPTEAPPPPWGPERKGSEGLKPQSTSLCSRREPLHPLPLLFFHSLLPSLSEPSFPVRTLAGSLKPDQKERENDLEELQPSILWPRVLKQGNPKACYLE